jgi:hypothetical protein
MLTFVEYAILFGSIKTKSILGLHPHPFQEFRPKFNIVPSIIYRLCPSAQFATKNSTSTTMIIGYATNVVRWYPKSLQKNLRYHAAIPSPSASR